MVLVSQKNILFALKHRFTTVLSGGSETKVFVDYGTVVPDTSILFEFHNNFSIFNTPSCWPLTISVSRIYLDYLLTSPSLMAGRHRSINKFQCLPTRRSHPIHIICFLVWLPGWHGTCVCWKADRRLLPHSVLWDIAYILWTSLLKCWYVVYLSALFF